MKYHAGFHSAEYYSENIIIAQRYLKHFHLLMDSEDICLDCCYFPSYAQKAFYLQVMRTGGKYNSHCAFTHYVDYHGLESFSQSFLTVEEADKHNAKRGEVYCKIVQLDAILINRIISAAKDYIPLASDSRIVIDGLYGNIRLFENGKVTKDILINDGSQIIQLLSEISDLI